MVSDAREHVPSGRTVIARRAGAFTIEEIFQRPGTAFGRHHHEVSSLFVVLSGHVEERAASRTIDCGRGSCGYIPAGAEHRSTFRQDGEHAHTLNIVLERAWLERCGIDPTADGPRYSGWGANPITGLRLLKECRRQGAAASPIALEELVLDLLGWSTGEAEGARAWMPYGDPLPLWLRDVIEFVHESAGDSAASLTTIADAIGRNPTHICRTFRAGLGCTMSEYARMVQIERASKLLRTTDDPIAVVARDAGFSDQSHFTRAFRSHFGIAPGAYRASLY